MVVALTPSSKNWFLHLFHKKKKYCPHMSHAVKETVELIIFFLIITHTVHQSFRSRLFGREWSITLENFSTGWAVFQKRYIKFRSRWSGSAFVRERACESNKNGHMGKGLPAPIQESSAGLLRIGCVHVTQTCTILLYDSRLPLCFLR